jgi:hypothetical protein
VANEDPSIDPYIRTLNSILRATAYGEWEYAQKVLEGRMDTANEDVEQVIVSGRIVGCDKLLLLTDMWLRSQDANNLAVILLNQGKLAEVSSPTCSLLSHVYEHLPRQFRY